MAEIIPTRGAALALAEEKRFIETGYEFLDEKRMLLAATLLEELARWREARAALDEKNAFAISTLKAALGRHGFAALARYPAPERGFEAFEMTSRNFLGIMLAEVRDVRWGPATPVEALDASEAAEACRSAFAALLPIAVEVAARAANIRRLIRDYRATERRARALENVILPETTATLAAIVEYLDESDQEEAIRIKNAARRDRNRG